MANRTFLHYKNKENKRGTFEYATVTPSLWQELFSLETIKSQKNRIIQALADHENNSRITRNSPTNLKIAKEAALENLQSVIDAGWNENADKTLLRKELLQYLRTEVMDNSTIEWSIEEICWLYNDPNEFFIELEQFHTNNRPLQEYPTEKATMQTIGFNDDFEPYSSIYQQISKEHQKNKAQNRTTYELETQKIHSKERKSKIIDWMTMSVIAALCTCLGLFIMVAKKELTGGMILLFIALICWLYVYLKHIRK